MAYEELMRGPEFTREFNGATRKLMEAHSALEIHDKDLMIALVPNGAPTLVHILHQPIHLVRAWRATQIIDSLKHITGPQAVADAYRGKKQFSNRRTT